jgi:hypothetical protein
VNGNGAYEGEMNEVVLFENALRAAVPTRPDPELGATLVPRLAGLARAATLEAEKHAVRRPTTAPRSRRALVARVAIAIAVIPLVFAGLAFAGVTVPGPAQDAFDAVGISLPNQPAKHADSNGDGSSHGKGAAGSETTTDETTTDKGNSDAAHEHALEQHQKAQGKALGHEKGKAIGLNGATPPGQKNKADKPSHPSHPSNAGGNSATHTTTHTTPAHTTPTTPGGGQGNGNANGHSK